MALQKQEMNVAFTDGVDTKTDSKLSSKLDVLENGYIGQTGTIQKRNGFDELSNSIYLGSSFTGTTMSKTELLVPNSNQLLSVSSDYAMIYNPSLGNKWVSELNGGSPFRQYQLTADSIRQTNLVGTPVSLFREESTTQEILLLNYRDLNSSLTDDGSYAISRKDLSTGAVYEEAATNTAGYKYDSCTLLNVGGKIIQTFKAGADIGALDITISSSGSRTLLVSDAASTDNGQYNTFSINGFLFLVYVTNNATIWTVKIKKYNSSLALQASTSFTSTDPVTYGFAMERDPVADTYVLFFSVAAVGVDIATYARAYNAALTSFTSASLISQGQNVSATQGLGKTAAYDSVNLQIILFGEFYFNSDCGVRTCKYKSGTFTNLSSQVTSRLASGAYYRDQRSYVVIAKATNVAGTFINVLVDENLDYISNASDVTTSLVGYDLTYGRALNNIIPVAASKFGSLLLTVNASNFICSSPRETIGKGVFAIGGLYEFSGGRISEAFFVNAPKINTNIVTAGLVPVGTYNYKVVYEFTDTNGQLTESLASDPFKVIVASISKNTFDIEQPTLTRRVTSGYNGVRIALYRQNIATETEYKFIGYDTFDNVADNSSNKALYTSGDALQNTPPPLTNIFTVHADRLFCVDEENKSLVFFTRKMRPGYGFQFNTTVNYIVCNNNSAGVSEVVTALGSIDDKLIVFKNNSIYVVFGDGPNGLGQGSFNDPKLLSSDVGCRDPRSIVSTSEGLYFMSGKGIYLLDRSLAVSYIGADVEAYNSLEITSAILLPSINQVRFTTRTGVALIYNYYVKQWSWFTNYDAQHATIWKGVYTHAKSSGKVRVESANFLDVAAVITLRVMLGWVKLQGIQSLQRIYRLMFVGDYKSSHSVTVNLSYDYEDYIWDTYNIALLGSDYNRVTKPTQAQIYSGANDGIYQYEIHLKRQKCQSIKIELFDVSQTGESFSLTGLSMTVGVKFGLDKLSSNKKF